MKIMLDCSPAKIRAYSERYGVEFWQLRTPLTQHAMAGVPYGLDNGCFSVFDKSRWRTLLQEADDAACNFENPVPPVFVALPDIVGDATRTLDLFEAFKVETNGLPRALVLQDGIGNHRIPWEDIAAVFVGGSDRFKESQESLNCCRAAKMLDKWVHVGRVNTFRRASRWLGLADSIDGSGMSRFDDRLEEVLEAIRGEHPQHALAIA